MSLLVAAIYYVGIPALILFAAQFCFGRVNTTLFKSMVAIASVVIGFGYFWWVAGEKMWVDHQVRELCAKDGGVKVYETVKLPSSKFNQYGQINFYHPIEKANALGSEYKYVWDVEYIEKGHPELIRQHSQVIRRADNKLLGELVGYTRSGGDPSGPWVGTHFSCPFNYSEFDLFGKIFVNGE